MPFIYSESNPSNKWPMERMHGFILPLFMFSYVDETKENERSRKGRDGKMRKRGEGKNENITCIVIIKFDIRDINEKNTGTKGNNKIILII